MMSILMEQLINITDAVFLGHVGEIELGASAIAGIYYLAVYMLGFGFSIGLQVMIARKNGEQDYQETGKIFFQGLFFSNGASPLSLPNGTYRFASHFQKIDQFSRNLPGNYPISGLA